MEDLKITISGTRGKSSIARSLHKIFYNNGYSTLSRETGLLPMVYYNENEIFLKRESSLPLNRLLEARIILDAFNNKKKEVLIFENNAIRDTYMRSFNEFINPEIVIIATVTPDHVLDQGPTMADTVKAFINSVPKRSFAVFWTNHKCEYTAIKKAFSQKKVKGVLLFSSLEDREKVILKSIQPLLEAKGFNIRLDAKTGKEDRKDAMEELTAIIGKKTFVNLGHINDPVHTYIAFEYLMSKLRLKGCYLLFNFRADRMERVPLFIDAFLPIVKHFVKGIIVHSDSIGFSSKFIAKKVREHIRDEKIEAYTCENYEDFIQKVLPKIPDGSTIVMVANTANDFGFKIIDKLKLFRETYPMLKKINLAE